jgi:hypothetical protein
MANNITGLKLSKENRGLIISLSGFNLLKVNFNAVNLPGGGIAGVKKYVISCSIARSQFSVSRNVTNYVTLSEKKQNLSVGDVLSSIPMEFKFSKMNLFPNGRIKAGIYFAIVTIKAKKNQIVDMKMSNFLTLE